MHVLETGIGVDPETWRAAAQPEAVRDARTTRQNSPKAASQLSSAVVLNPDSRTVVGRQGAGARQTVGGVPAKSSLTFQSLDEPAARTIARVHGGHRRPLDLFDAASELNCDIRNCATSTAAILPAGASGC